jgi:hypothetical protein
MYKISKNSVFCFHFICFSIAMFFFVTPLGLQSAAVSNWTHVQLVIYENRLSGIRPECSDQHFNKRIYARKIHERLDKNGRWPFVVDARSSIDTIVISLKIRASKKDYAIIQSRLEQALHAPTSQALMAAELRLLLVDENLRKSRPSQDEMFFKQLAKTFGPKLAVNCGTVPGENLTSFELKENATPAYQIFFPNEQQMLGIQPVAATKPSKKYVEHLTKYVKHQSVYSRRNENQATDQKQENMPSNTLFVSLVDDYSAQQHIIALAKIYTAARDSGLANPDIRPLGIGGFLITASSDELIGLEKNLSNVLDIDSSDTEKLADILMIDATANSMVCHARTGSNLQLWAETTFSHPYFQFWMYAPECKDKENKLWNARKKFYQKPTNFYTQFLA